MNVLFKNKSLLIVCFSVLFFAASGSVFSSGTYSYDSILVDITINQNSTFDVIEKQTYSLNGNFGYFYRDIKFKNLDHISNIEVFDSEGKKLSKDEYKVSYKAGYVSIRWDFDRQDFNNELKSWIIKYKVHGGLGFYDDYDELYWNAIFADDRTAPVKHAEAAVHLPKEFSESEIGKKMFIGPLDSKSESSNYEIIDNKTILFQGNNLGSSDFLTIVATWPKGAVVKPFLYRNQIINWIVLLISIIFPLFVFFKAYKAWRKSGKDEKINKTVIAQYDPPSISKKTGSISPALMGVLMKQEVNIKDILATVIDLAVRGYLRIKEEENKILFFKSKEYVFERLKSEGNDLKPFEREIMEGIFGNKDLVFDSDLKNKFYKHIPKIKKMIFSEMEKETDYFSGNIDKIRKKYSLKYFIFPSILFALIFITGLLSGYLSGMSSLYISFFVASMIFSLIIGMSFSYYMPALTKKGAEAKWHSLGFKEYLHTAERFRIGAETIDTFSKFLPYAMVFGVEKEWAKRFSDFSFKEQNWYIPLAVYASSQEGAPVSSISDFSSSFSSFASSISGTFSSSPGGGSGMGGGGGAGGGGGGGGGGAG